MAPAMNAPTTKDVVEELRALARLATPLVIGQMSQVGMGLTDTIMAGRLGTIDLAAVAIGSTVWLPVYLTCLGVFMAVSPIVATLHGAGRAAQVGRTWGQALWLAAAFGACALPATIALGSALGPLGIDARIVPTSAAYLRAVAWGMPGACLFMAARFLHEGSGHTRTVMAVQLVALVANAIGNYVFMYGAAGFPALGAVGAGWSTATVFWLEGVALALAAARSRRFAACALRDGLGRPNLAVLRTITGLGIPIALSVLMEVGMFTGVSLLMGTLGAVPVAAHQVALNYAAFMFMMPLGVSLAATVRVGQAAGRGDRAGLQLAGYAGMALATSAMALSACIMLLFPGPIVRLYTPDPAVREVAMKLLFLAAAFQLSDGLQVAAAGALRGLKDTRRPMLITFVAYWIIGLPVAWFLGISNALGPGGLWLGLVAGLTSAAAALTWRFHRLSRDRRWTATMPAAD